MPVYLELFHGRKSVDEKLEDWGSRGPILGPFAFIHTTYAADIKVRTEDGAEAVLSLVGDETPDLLFYDGIFYGDWSAFGPELLNAAQRQRVETFDPRKADFRSYSR